MTYSIIIPYRNREDHIKIIVPQLRKLFPDAELLVVEQNDNAKFRKASLLNVGAQQSNGDILILQDVDYFPLDTVQYYDGKSDVYLPVKFVEFVYNDLSRKPMNEVPGGYQHFINGVDDNFFGGIVVIKKTKFFQINGSCSLYKGWQGEDEDLRNRCMFHKLNIVRNSTNKFLALDHPDSGPPFTDSDFIDNINRVQHSHDFFKFGISTTKATITFDKPLVPGIDKWIKATNFDGVGSLVQTSKFNYDEEG